MVKENKNLTVYCINITKMAENFVGCYPQHQKYPYGTTLRLKFGGVLPWEGCNIPTFELCSQKRG